MIPLSNKGSQFTAGDWQALLVVYGMDCSVSRRGDCHNNAVAESYFHLLKRARICFEIHLTKAAAQSDILDYIEMF